MKTFLIISNLSLMAFLALGISMLKEASKTVPKAKLEVYEYLIVDHEKEINMLKKQFDRLHQSCNNKEEAKGDL